MDIRRATGSSLGHSLLCPEITKARVDFFVFPEYLLQRNTFVILPPILPGVIMSKRFLALSAFIIGMVVLVVYQPSFKIGHEGSWWFLDYAARLSLPDYFRQYFDPALSTRGYRPMEGMLVLVEYSIFRFNADGYHLAQILMHAANGILLLSIVTRLARNARLGLLAGLAYVTLPAYHLAVFRVPSVIDPLVGCFYLGAIRAWIAFLDSRRRLAYLLAIGAYALALLTKEVAVFIPLVLFMVDYFFVRKRLSWRALLSEYAAFAIVLIPYLALELDVQRHGEFPAQWGFSLGWHFINNLMPYLAVSTFPWYTDNFVVPADPLMYIWLIIIGVAVLLALVARRKWLPVCAVLGFFAIANLAPLLGFPQEWFQERYLYLPLMSVAVLCAFVLEMVGPRLPHPWPARLAPSLALALLVLAGGTLVAGKAAEWSELTRQIRVPFRDITRLHPSFPDDTLIYFLYPTTTALPDFKGLFLVWYGTGVTVSGTDDLARANLRAHAASYVYYFDSSNRPREIAVDRNANLRVSLAFPAQFDVPIRLDGFDLANPSLRAGEPLALLLYWQSVGTIERDYTVFVHLLDAEGKTIEGYDSSPSRGAWPTTVWKLSQVTPDGILLHVPTDVSPGSYRLEIGLYDPATTERLTFTDAAGQVASSFVIEPINVLPQAAPESVLTR